jgi:hypothetical protein
MPAVGRDDFQSFEQGLQSWKLLIQEVRRHGGRFASRVAKGESHQSQVGVGKAQALIDTDGLIPGDLVQFARILFAKLSADGTQGNYGEDGDGDNGAQNKDPEDPAQNCETSPT